MWRVPFNFLKYLRSQSLATKSLSVVCRRKDVANSAPAQWPRDSKSMQPHARFQILCLPKIVVGIYGRQAERYIAHIAAGDELRNWMKQRTQKYPTYYLQRQRQTLVRHLHISAYPFTVILAPCLTKFWSCCRMTSSPAAFGMAASTIQFVLPSTALLKMDVKIHDHISGLFKELNGDETYQDLNRCSSVLRDSHNIDLKIVKTISVR